MTAARRDIEVEVGAAYGRTFIWKNGAGVPFNLTGYAARMQIRKTALAAAFIVELTTGNAGIVIDPLVGSVTLHLTAVQTRALGAQAHDSAVYDLWLDPGGAPSEASIRLLYGSVKILTPVTR